MRLVMIGPPGAGKGTQARMLHDRFGIPQVASGDLLRAAVRAKTPLGVKAREFMDRGELVPDELVLGLIENRLAEPDAKGGFILDGFPRNVDQAQTLASMLKRGKQSIDKVIAITVPDEELVKRISGRRTCGKCGAMYHVIFDPPRNMNVCDKCNAEELYQRDDDAEDTVRMRLQVYAANTRPLLDHYGRMGLMALIDGMGTPNDVQKRILDAIDGAAGAAKAKA